MSATLSTAIIIGVDPHTFIPAAVAINALGARLSALPDHAESRDRKGILKIKELEHVRIEKAEQLF